MLSSTVVMPAAANMRGVGMSGAVAGGLASVGTSALEAAADSRVFPAKLFIGGITRHTTTKQLRDHFSQFGRVLDCVAMRQPDGRPRGFGYVTLDSQAAADRCLAAPQVVDGRTVDMKRAVPEGSGSPTECQGSAYSGMNLGAGMHMPVPPGAWGMWPDALAGAHYLGPSHHDMTLPSSISSSADARGLLATEQAVQWHWGGASPISPISPKATSDVPDCVDILSRHPPLLSFCPDTPTASISYTELLGLHERPLTPGPVTAGLLPSDAVVSPKSLSASAPEFVPACARISTPADATTEIVDGQRVVLHNITNLIHNIDAIKTTDGSEKDGKCVKPGDAVCRASHTVKGLELKQIDRPDNTPSLLKIRADSSEDEDDDVEERAAVPIAHEVLPKKDEQEAAVSVALPADASLPSMGSAEHAAGTCKRCNFFPKGRCQNGFNCTFCHFPHEKRKPSRQEKRERRAAWLTQHGGMDEYEESDSGDSECDAQRFTAYAVLPGMPPIRATKLPDQLCLPGNYHMPEAGVSCLPPGLGFPQCGGLEIPSWQPDEEVSPTRYEYDAVPLPSAAFSRPILGTVPMTPSAAQSVATSPTGTAQMMDMFSEPPTPNSMGLMAGCSEPPTPSNMAMVTPTAAATAGKPSLLTTAAPAQAVLAASQAGRSPKETMTMSTQTADEEDIFAACSRCGEVDAKTGKPVCGRSFDREELLRLRESLIEKSALSPLPFAQFRTVAASASELC